MCPNFGCTHSFAYESSLRKHVKEFHENVNYCYPMQPVQIDLKGLEMNAPVEPLVRSDLLDKQQWPQSQPLNNQSLMENFAQRDIRQLEDPVQFLNVLNLKKDNQDLEKVALDFQKKGF